MKDILKKIIINKPINIGKRNINRSFKTVRMSFLHLVKIMYPSNELINTLFSVTKVTKLGISFSGGNEYIVFCLMQNNTVIEHTRV